MLWYAIGGYQHQQRAGWRIQRGVLQMVLRRWEIRLYEPRGAAGFSGGSYVQRTMAPGTGQGLLHSPAAKTEPLEVVGDMTIPSEIIDFRGYSLCLLLAEN